MTAPFLSGSAEWAKLSPAQQAAIGATAIEIVLCWIGADAEPVHPATERTRLFEQAEVALNDRLHQAVLAAVPAVDADLVPLPQDWTIELEPVQEPEQRAGPASRTLPAIALCALAGGPEFLFLRPAAEDRALVADPIDQDRAEWDAAPRW
jgi:hypothetical protein